jgi:PPM family protein phosphatase
LTKLVAICLESVASAPLLRGYLKRTNVVKTFISSAAKSDIGKRRSSNQDHFLVADICPALRLATNGLGLQSVGSLLGNPRGHLFVVADGMGGHQGGNRASELVVQEVASRVVEMASIFRSGEPPLADEFLPALKAIVEAVNRKIIDESTANKEYKGMGTTLTLVIIVDGTMFLAHVGDSRCYRLRDGNIQQLTEDHTMASQLANQSGIDRILLEKSPWSNVLWNAIGGNVDRVQTDLQCLEIQAGDRYLLCSDGLNKHVSDSEILQLLLTKTPPEVVCTQLVDLAIEAGGSDNITAVVFDALPWDTADSVKTATSIFQDKKRYSAAD